MIDLAVVAPPTRGLRPNDVFLILAVLFLILAIRSVWRAWKGGRR